MELTVLGCGDAFGNGGRHHTSFLISNGGEGVLLDCGASTLIRLKHEGISLESISTIIISHFHGDHYGGIPFFLISSLFESQRLNPLTLIGPDGIKEQVFKLQELMYPDTSQKLADLDIQFAEFKEGKSIHLGDKKIYTERVEHSPPSIPYGIRLEWNNKIISYSGDTSWTDNLLSLSNGADLFICECNFLTGSRFGHLSFEEISEKKGLFNCIQLWLTHMNEELYQSSEVEEYRLFEGQKIEF